MEETTNSGKIRYDVNETPPLWMSILLGITHVALILDAIVFIPNMIGKTSNLPPEQIEYTTFASIIVAAICTLIQTIRVGRIGAGFVLFMGSYSAFLACSLDAVHMGGLPLMATMGILSAPVVLLYSYFLRYLRHIVTPAIGGVVVMLVAVALVPIGLTQWMGGNPALPSYGSTDACLTGGITIFTLTFLLLLGNNGIRLWTPIIGLAAGYLTAWHFDLLDLSHFNSAALFGLPRGEWPGLTTDLKWEHAPLAASFLIASLVSAMEGTGNIMLVQQVSERNFHKIKYESIQGGLFCDGLGKILAGLSGTAPNATYCDNIPLMEMTGVSSRIIGICGAGLLGIIAFVPKIGGFILDMPSPVVGGMLVVISAMLFYSGISLVIASGLNFQKGMVLGLSLCAGILAESGTFFPDIIPSCLVPLLQNGVAVGGFTAFFLSTLIYLLPKSSIIFTLAPKEDNFPLLMKKLEKSVKKLKLSDTEYMRLQLACEETFLHMISLKDEAEELIVRIIREEDELFVEVISGEKFEDVDQVLRPARNLDASQEGLKKLGLIILQRTVKELRHVDISGYTYISFYIPA
ncbi:solute carrier family 23 protein [Desulfoluna sp.]|uniref:uracil-xanthine permease family protein n=1 Tax=Desulfoluna sp. TaxID=2045199 RepID=UPI002628D019|nr:solute carrier family 23 protein [Desulfoluna sp.]